MMMKEYKHLIKLQRFPMERMYLKCVRIKCYHKFSHTDRDKDKDKDKTSTEDKNNTTTKTEDKN